MEASWPGSRADWVAETVLIRRDIRGGTRYFLTRGLSSPTRGLPHRPQPAAPPRFFGNLVFLSWGPTMTLGDFFRAKRILFVRIQ